MTLTVSVPIRMPYAKVLAPGSFVAATLLIYWGGWETTWKLLVAIGLGFIVFVRRTATQRSVQPRRARCAHLHLAGALLCRSGPADLLRPVHWWDGESCPSASIWRSQPSSAWRSTSSPFGSRRPPNWWPATSRRTPNPTLPSRATVSAWSVATPVNSGGGWPA